MPTVEARLARLETTIDYLKRSGDSCLKEVHDLTVTFDEYREAERSRLVEERRERKSDLKYIVTTIIAAAGMVVAAVALLSS